mgnify:FL=1
MIHRFFGAFCRSFSGERGFLFYLELIVTKIPDLISGQV